MRESSPQLGQRHSGALTGEAVEGAKDTESTPVGRCCGGMKTVAGAAGDAGFGAAAAVLCGARAEDRVKITWSREADAGGGGGAGAEGS
jgi:hypothetical protein